jgi:hypothetical protein
VVSYCLTVFECQCWTTLPGSLGLRCEGRRARARTVMTTRRVMIPADQDIVGFFLGVSLGRMKDTDSPNSDSDESESLSFPSNVRSVSSS